MTSAPRLFMIAGETSGDQLGGWLMAALKAKQPAISFMGVGGPMMEAQGLISQFPMREISLIGIAEILPHVRTIRRRIRDTVTAIEREKPDMVVSIDSPGFVLRVIKQLRARGIHRPKLVHYVAPTVWAYRPERATLMAERFDFLLCLLPFEPPYFDAVKLPNRFIGHEIAWWWKIRGDGQAFRATHGLSDAPVLAVFPGSRNGEINRLWPVFRESIAQLKAQIPELRVVIQVPTHLMERMMHEVSATGSVAPPLKGSQIALRDLVGGQLSPASPMPDLAAPDTPHRNAEGAFRLPLKGGATELATLPAPLSLPSYCQVLANTDDKKGLFAAATAAIAKSGTIGLECALAGLPSIIAYRASKLTAYLVRRMITVKFVNLANLLAGKMIIPELIQEDCTAEKVTAAMLPLLRDASAREAQQRELAGVANMLGVNDAQSPSEKAADVLLGMVD